MFQYNKLNSELSFFQKVKKLDFILIFCIILLSAISLLVMYSTDGGEILYHTKSHFIKLLTFFSLMMVISFFNIKIWHITSYFIYFIIILLLIWVSVYGIKVSGSQRWINLYFIVLQPSELMKIGIILCLAKYYHRLKIENVNSFTTIIVSLSIIIIPIILVLSQPDLGTSILIALSGLIVLWLGGVKMKIFFYFVNWFFDFTPFYYLFFEAISKNENFNIFRS